MNPKRIKTGIRETTAPALINPHETSYFCIKKFSPTGRVLTLSLLRKTTPNISSFHALINENATYLSEWASHLTLPGKGATFFNFTASHDGIGVRPLKGLVPDKDIDTMVQITRKRGGDVSYKTDKFPCVSLGNLV